MTSEMKCRFSVSTKLAGVCDTDSYRYGLDNAVVVPGGDGHVLLCATDGRIAAVVEVPGETDTIRYVPKGVLPNGAGDCELNGAWRVTTGVHKKKTAICDPVPDDGSAARYPDLSKVLDSNAVTLQSHVAIGIDAELLSSLAKAITTDGRVTLFIARPGERDTSVDGCAYAVGDVGAGCIMPFAVNNKAGKESTTAKGFLERFKAIAARLRMHWGQPIEAVSPSLRS